MTASALQLKPDTRPSSTGATPAPALMVDVVVLTGDLALYESIRDAVGERNPVWRARSAEESVDLLLTGRCGVLLIDLAAVTARPTTLVEQIVDQFPDVVVVVAGRREDEAVLAGLVGDGLVYRFMHKPLSPKRAGMFLNAAIRSHVERREGRMAEPLLPLVRELHSRVDPRKWLFVGGGTILFLAVLAGMLIARYGEPPDADPSAAASRMALPATPLADPVLSRARAALDAGRYDAPPGRNALDLFSAVLLTRPGDIEARRGLQTTIERLLEKAERAAASGDAAEARRIAERVLQVDPDDDGAHAVIAGLGRPRPGSTPVTAAVAPATPARATPTLATTTRATPTLATPSASLPAGDDDDRRLARVPVTPLAPAPASLPAPPTVPARAARVQADPLTPRIVGPGVLPTSPDRRPPPAASRHSGGPVAPSLPIAGDAKPDPQSTARSVAAPAVAGEHVPQQRDLEPLATPDPDYPPEAFRRGIAGWVEVEYTVDERGAARDVTVVAAEPRGMFEEAAIAAVGRWRYRPRVVNGQPVAQRTSVTLSFSVGD